MVRLSESESVYHIRSGTFEGGTDRHVEEGRAKNKFFS